MALVVNDRVKETSTTTGTGTFNLAGAATGFDTFVAGIGDTNTTYYAIFNQGTTEWEVGLGTVTDAATDTLARTTIYSSSNSDSAVDFAAGTKDVFCTLPASKAVFGKQEGTNFTDSLLVGHSTTGTLSTADKNTGVGIDAMDAITSGDQNSFLGFGAGSLLTTSGQNTGVGHMALGSAAPGTGNTAFGHNALYYCSGDKNIALGWTAANNVTSGDGNVIIGNINAGSATGDKQLLLADGKDGTIVWLTGASDGNLEVPPNWNPSLSTTGKAFVMGF